MPNLFFSIDILVASSASFTSIKDFFKCLLFLSLFIFLSAISTNSVHANAPESIKKTIENAEKQTSLISDRLSSLESFPKKTDEQQQQMDLLLQQKSYLQETIESARRTRELYVLSERAPRDFREAEKELLVPIPPEVRTNLPVEKLQLNREAATASLNAARKERLQLAAEAAQRNERIQGFATETAEIIKQLDEVSSNLTSPDISESYSLEDFTRNTNIAKQQFLTQRLYELTMEKRSYEARRDLLRVRRQLAEKKILILEKRIDAFDIAIQTFRSNEVNNVAAIASAEELASMHPLLREVVEDNIKLAAELINVETQSNLIAQDKKKSQTELDELTNKYQDTKTRLSQFGSTDAVGLRLRNARNQLPDSGQLTASVNKLRDEVNRVQIRRIEIEEQIFELVDSARVADSIIEGAYILEASEKAELKEELTQSFEEKKNKYLNDLLSAYDAYFENQLLPFIDSQRALLRITSEYKNFIDSRILWIQSSRVAELKDIRRSVTALAQLFRPDFLRDLTLGFRSDFVNAYYFYIPFILIIGAMLGSRKKIKQEIALAGTYATNVEKARIADTFKALFLTMLLVLPWFLVFFIIGWRIENIDSDPVLVSVYSSSFINLAYAVLVFLFARAIVCKKGVAECHFFWNEGNVILIRNLISWLYPFLLPLLFILFAVSAQSSRAHFESLERWVFILSMIPIWMAVKKALNPESGLPKIYITSAKQSWFSKLAPIWYPTALMVPVFLILAALAGYVYTVIKISGSFAISVAIIYALVILRGLLKRWLSIAHNKMSLEELKAAHSELDRDRESTNEAPSVAIDKGVDSLNTASAILISQEKMLSLNTINDQSLRLLNSAFWVATIAFLVVIWAEVLPAFRIFDGVVLWTTTVEGSKEAGALTTSHAITLADVVSAILVLIVTILLSNNIPGLLEIAVLQRLPISPSGRYAITTSARYLLVVVGLLMGFNALGVGWSKVQWLAAAITVGLGFGLQEIFANFFSGLIILYERQIRVGDIVTVGNISGKVSRIQMRATTITDWDRKELIIPNKEFVTSQVINWSLSDTTLRIVLTVGIAYGSDTELAYKELMQAAQDNKNVMDNPEPTVRFMQFGDSSLNFELRVFIPHPDLLLETRHDLNMAINERFRAAGITIPFPQRDIHIISQES